MTEPSYTPDPDLLPCPFCGNRAMLGHNSEPRRDGGAEHAFWVDCSGVMLGSCHCSLGYYERHNHREWGYFVNPEEAITTWNERSFPVYRPQQPT